MPMGWILNADGDEMYMPMGRIVNANGEDCKCQWGGF